MGRLGEPEQSEGDTSPRYPGPTFYTSDMSYGLHWEWRGFGRLDQAAREHIVRKYDFQNVGLKANLRLINKLLPMRLRLEP